MITLSEAYKIVKPHISNDFKIEACCEFEDYYAFPTKWRDRRHDYRAGGGPLGIQKSTGKLCLIGVDTSKLCYCSWDYETLKRISDDIGKATREYSEEELKALVSSRE